MKLKRFFAFLTISGTLFFVVNVMKQQSIFKAPKTISEEVRIALSYYPDLKDIPIEFKFKEHIKKSTMQAQPKFSSFFKSRKKRSYVVLISKHIKISNKEFRTKDIPRAVMIGWLGHELGHIVDYQSRDNLNLVGFGLQYLFSVDYIKHAERTADSVAVDRGMGEYIIATKRFILDHAEISETYKSRMRKFYLSPEEIMQMVEKVDSVSN